MLWEYDKYTTDQAAIMNSTIIEYDMRAANTSLAREFNLLPEDFIKHLVELPKKQREVEVGLYKRKHKDYNELEKKAFAKARLMFFEMNDLHPDRIVSIKRDAIFTRNRVKYTKLTKNIEFRLKHEYDSFIQIKPLEMYYESGRPLDVKGINSDVYDEYHHQYFGKYIEGVFKRAETQSIEEVLKYLSHTLDAYKWRDLPIGCYREFNALSQYLCNDGRYWNMVEELTDVNIEYNFRFLCKLMGVLF